MYQKSKIRLAAGPVRTPDSLNINLQRSSRLAGRAPWIKGRERGKRNRKGEKGWERWKFEAHIYAIIMIINDKPPNLNIF